MKIQKCLEPHEFFCLLQKIYVQYQTDVIPSRRFIYYMIWLQISTKAGNKRTYWVLFKLDWIVERNSHLQSFINKQLSGLMCFYLVISYGYGKIRLGVHVSFLSAGFSNVYC